MHVKCPSCQTTFVTQRFGRQFCPNCGIQLDVPAPGGSQPPAASPPQPPPTEPPPPPSGGSWGGDGPGTPEQPSLEAAPWERRQEVGFFNGLFQTWVESTFHPTRFFSRLAPGRFSDALLYALIITTIGSLFGYAWSGLYEASLLGYFADAGLHAGAMAETTVGAWILGMLFIPLGVAFYIFVGGAILHLCCMIFGCASRGFETTLRTVCYSTGAMLFSVVPLCGTVISQIWIAVVRIIGIQHQQQTTLGRAAGAVLLPLIVGLLFCVCAMVGVAALGMASVF